MHSQQPLIEADGAEQQMHEMPHGDGAFKYGGPPNGGGYGSRGAEQKVVQVEGPPSEMPVNQEEMRHELA